jgi:hypothetical protein
VAPFSRGCGAASTWLTAGRGPALGPSPSSRRERREARRARDVYVAGCGATSACSQPCAGSGRGRAPCAPTSTASSSGTVGRAHSLTSRIVDLLSSMSFLFPFSLFPTLANPILQRDQHHRRRPDAPRRRQRLHLGRGGRGHRCCAFFFFFFFFFGHWARGDFWSLSRTAVVCGGRRTWAFELGGSRRWRKRDASTSNSCRSRARAGNETRAGDASEWRGRRASPSVAESRRVPGTGGVPEIGPLELVEAEETRASQRRGRRGSSPPPPSWHSSRGLPLDTSGRVWDWRSAYQNLRPQSRSIGLRARGGGGDETRARMPSPACPVVLAGVGRRRDAGGGRLPVRLGLKMGALAPMLVWGVCGRYFPG